MSFPDVLSDIPGYTPLNLHNINANLKQPIRSKSSAVPFALRGVVVDEVREIPELNIFETRNCPHCSLSGFGKEENQ